MRIRKFKGLVFMLPALVYFLLFNYYPLIDSLRVSLSGRGISYYQVLTDEYFWQALWNTLYFAFLSTLVLVLLSTLIAFFLDELRDRRLEQFFSVVLLLPLITSSVAAGLIWEWIFHPIYGSVNMILEVIGITPQSWLKSERQVIPSLVIIQTWLTLGFGTLIILSGFKNIPDELYQAAEIDGARFWQRFFRVSLPIVMPQILVTSIVQTISNIKAFDLPYVTTMGGPNNASRLLIMYLYETAFDFGSFARAGAIALIIFIIVLGASIAEYVIGRRHAE